MARLPAGEGRVLLRYLASEYNRFWFSVWGWVEMALAIILLGIAIAWPPGNSAKHLRMGFSIMLAITVLMAFWLTPEIVQVGRQMDFVPREPPPPALAIFGRLHGVYSILDLVKLIVGFWMVALLRTLQSEPRPLRSVHQSLVHATLVVTP